MNLQVKAQAGWCLWYAQEVLVVPHLYRSAWDAWTATKLKHTDRNIPNGVPVCFSHYGTYGTPPTYGLWGHVVVKASNKFYSAPGTGVGFNVYNTIEEIEKNYNSKFVGWSEDISGVKVGSMIDKSTLTVIFNALLGRVPDAGAITHYVGKYDVAFVLNDVNGSTERKNYVAKQKALASNLLDVTNRLNNANKEIASLKNITSTPMAGDTPMAIETNSILKSIKVLLERIFK